MLQIGAEDEDGFERAKDWLLDGFDRWLRDERQLDVGLTSIAVGDAAILGIRSGTVKIHLKHIFEKTGIRGRYGLALSGLREKGLLAMVE